MATISDGMYNSAGNLVQIRGDSTKACLTPTIVGFSDTQLAPQPEGMEQRSVWSSYLTGGSDRAGANYPCAFGSGQLCQQGLQPTSCDLVCKPTLPNECGKSLKHRENSVWPAVTGSAGGDGYVTTNWLSPNQPFARLGQCWVSRAVLDNNPNISQLYIDGKIAVHYFSKGAGQPFLFKTPQTLFIYMVPNAIMVRASGGLSYRVDTSTADQQGQSCQNCL